MMRVIRLVLLCLAVIVCQNTVGEHLVVPGTYASIQAAIDNAVPGDSIEVQAGIYEETLLFKEGIELKGAGPESTIVRVASADGVVLQIKDAARGNISGFTFTHSDTTSLNPNSKDLPDAVDVSNSRVEIRNCFLGPSAGCGIAVRENSDGSVVECRAEGNCRGGIYVRGEGTQAKLLRNACSNNHWGGICLTKGAKAVAEENSCLNNNRWGVYVLNRGTSIELKNNIITGNTGPGILIDKWANGVVVGNTCSNNEENGIFFRLAATGAVTGNICENNTWNGIVVQSLATDSAVQDNTCSSNGNNGITICLGAGGEVARNTCTGNTSCGIYVSSWYTAPSIKENECNENKMHGIAFRCGAAGRADGNVCRGNNLHGILVSDENTEPEIGDNRCEENGGQEVAREAGDPISRQDQVEADEIGCSLAGEHFDALENMATLLRRHKCRYSGGGWQLGSFYTGLQKGCGTISPKQREVFEALLEQWKQAYPASVTPRIVQALVHSAYGWEARGGGYANTVTDEGWKVFRKELGIAENILLEAEVLNSNDPQFYATMIDICNGLNYSSQELQAFFDKAIAIDMGYFPVYYSRAWSLSRRWGGGPGELEHFAETVVTLTEEHYGTTLYAQIAASMATHLGEDEFAEDHFFDWKRIDDGYIRLAEEFPESTFYLNQHCLLACIYHQQEKAQSLFRKIGDTHERWVWRGDSGFQAWKQWAFDMAPAPHPKAPDSLPKPIPGSALSSLLPAEVVMLFKAFPLIPGALLFILSAVVAISLLYFTRRKTRLRSQVQEDHPEDKHNEDDGSAL